MIEVVFEKRKCLESVNAPLWDSQDRLLSSASFGFFMFFLRVCLFVAVVVLFFGNVVFDYIKPWADGL